jgi:hypothetical protein
VYPLEPDTRAQRHRHATGAIALGVWALLALLVCTLAACDAPNQSNPLIATSAYSPFPGTQAPTRQIATRVPEPTDPPRSPGSKEAFDTRVALREIAIKTAGALTPTELPGSPTVTWTPRPTPTLTFGWIECGGGDSRQPQYTTCWQGMFNGQVLLVQAGREGYQGDIGQGVISVWIVGQDGRYHDDGAYRTPSRQGAVHIVSIDGARVYLAVDELQPPDLGGTPVATPGVIFVFDLATRQWVSP